MTAPEKQTIKQIKEELINLKLQMKVMTEEEYKKRVARALKWIDEVLIDK